MEHTPPPAHLISVTTTQLGGLVVEPGPPTCADVLVVIPCLNEHCHIKNVIAVILRDSAARRLVLVIADGGSTDGTRELVAELAQDSPGIRLIPNPLKIQSAGVNRAVRMFGENCRWLVRMDAHAEYPEGFISQLLAEAERTGASSVVVAMKARGTSCFQKAAAFAQNSVLGAGGSRHRRDGSEGFVDHGHHALFDLHQFVELGGYDETQSHNEDAEFDVRLARSGGRIWLTRATDVTYFPRSHARDLYRQYCNYGRGRARTILRHRMRPKPRQLAPAAVLPSLLAACSAHWLWLAALPAELWLVACLAGGLFLGIREHSRCALAAGCAAPIIHLAWSIGFWSAVFGAAAGQLARPPLAVRLRP